MRAHADGSFRDTTDNAGDKVQSTIVQRICQGVRVEGNKMEAGEQLRIAGLPCVPRGEEEQEES